MLAFQELVLSVVEKIAVVFFFNDGYKVRSKEMNEMRMNHCRGVVNNSVVAQNRRGQIPEGISHVNVSYKLS